MFGDDFAGIDWAAGDIPDALAGDVPATPSLPDPAAFKQAISDTRIEWLPYRTFKDCVMKGELADALKLCSTWVGCKLLGGPEEKVSYRIYRITC